MREFVLEFLPIVIVAAIIGAFTIAFLLAYAALRKHKDPSDDRERNMSDGEIVIRLLRYAKPYWKSFVGVFFIMLFSIVYDLISPVLVADIQDLMEQMTLQGLLAEAQDGQFTVLTLGPMAPEVLQYELRVRIRVQ